MTGKGGLLVVGALLAAAAVAGCMEDTGIGTSGKDEGSTFSYGGTENLRTGTDDHPWDNPQTKGYVSWGGNAQSGTLKVSILDADDDVVYQHEFGPSSTSGGAGETAKGTAGTWTVRLEYVAFSGTVGLTVSPR